MVERNKGLRIPEPSRLVVPEKKQLTNEDIIGMFGANHRKLIEDRVSQLGITDKLRFFDSPRPHEGSDALYVVEQFVGDDLILVPVLIEKKKTSRHYHEKPMVQEKYFYIAGESFVDLGEETLTLSRKQNLIEVPLGVVHQVRTQENPSLTLIIMEKARLVSPGRLHVKTSSDIV